MAGKKGMGGYKELWEAVWPVVVLRIAAFFVSVALIILASLWAGGSIEVASALLPLVLVSYVAAYAYGGYRAVSKFGFSINKSLAICGAVGILASGIVSWRGDFAQYGIAIFIEAFVAVIGGFVGALIAKAMKK